MGGGEEAAVQGERACVKKRRNTQFISEIVADRLHVSKADAYGLLGLVRGKLMSTLRG